MGQVVWVRSRRSSSEISVSLAVVRKFAKIPHPSPWKSGIFYFHCFSLENVKTNVGIKITSYTKYRYSKSFQSAFTATFLWSFRSCRWRWSSLVRLQWWRCISTFVWWFQFDLLFTLSFHSFKLKSRSIAHWSINTSVSTSISLKIVKTAIFCWNFVTIKAWTKWSKEGNDWQNLKLPTSWDSCCKPLSIFIVS